MMTSSKKSKEISSCTIMFTTSLWNISISLGILSRETRLSISISRWTNIL